MEKESERRAVAVRVANSANDLEREALLLWMFQLIQVRESHLSNWKKARSAVKLTLESKVVWPIVKILSLEVKRLGWDERGTKSRFGIIGSGIGLTLFGTQGAGIAALGTAIGVPLWVVLGTGAYFAPVLIDELKKKIPRHRQPIVAPQEQLLNFDGLSFSSLKKIDLLNSSPAALDENPTLDNVKFESENGQELVVTLPQGADVNDVIECAKCLHKLTVTHVWLDELAQRVGASRLLRLDQGMLKRLRCTECSSRNFIVVQARLPDVNIADEIKPFMCGICGGDGGAGGRCWKCGGTGFADA
ncbi:hypothetical protein [Janthinobacterium svalbardensis]|uniref:hypothetical protein n=1 Tax=Janthinobacterium svalbardensis TaxID=368607 RepID=UPI0012FD8778|nr:hypothetical protein [Janthinobacterium svalbardensis]